MYISEVFLWKNHKSIIPSQESPNMYVDTMHVCVTGLVKDLANERFVAKQGNRVSLQSEYKKEVTPLILNE